MDFRALPRLVDWRTRMAANHEFAMMTPFKWGEHDCGRYGDKHFEAITGVPLAADLVGHTTAIGALKTLKAGGYDSLLDFMEKNLNPIGLPFARVADFALVNALEETVEGTGWAVGIYLGEKVGLLAPQGYGIIARSDPRVKFAFMVGI